MEKTAQGIGRRKARRATEDDKGTFRTGYGSHERGDQTLGKWVRVNGRIWGGK